MTNANAEQANYMAEIPGTDKYFDPMAQLAYERGLKHGRILEKEAQQSSPAGDHIADAGKMVSPLPEVEELAEEITRLVETNCHGMTVKEAGRKAYRQRIAAILTRYGLAVRENALQTLLDTAHGGGNWRRIAEQLKAQNEKGGE